PHRGDRPFPPRPAPALDRAGRAGEEAAPPGRARGPRKSDREGSSTLPRPSWVVETSRSDCCERVARVRQFPPREEHVSLVTGSGQPALGNRGKADERRAAGGQEPAAGGRDGDRRGPGAARDSKELVIYHDRGVLARYRRARPRCRPARRLL